jgi:aspartate kinase
MIVMKFGGTSMGSAETILAKVSPVVGSAVRGGKSPVVVVSAMSGVTNQLLIAAEGAVARDVQALRTTLDQILDRHQVAVGRMVKDVVALRLASERIELELQRLRVFLEAVAVVGELSCRSKDVVLAVGEKLSAILLSAALTDLGIAAECVPLDNVIQGKLRYGTEDYWKDVLQLLETRFGALQSGVVPVATGFLGPTEGGILHSVGRGYSDFCASLIGAALGAEEIQIWTDVNGVLSGNPKVVPEAFLLETISFDEMAELAHFGAKVLHPSCVAPALKAGIPIRILNTFESHCPGTLVVQGQPQETGLPFKSISYKKDVTIVRIASPVMLFAHGYVGKVGKVFGDHGISIDLIATSEVSVSLTVERRPQDLEELVADLSTLGKVTLHGGQTIICLVGVELGRGDCVASRVFSVMAQEGIRPRMISMGDALINLSLVVPDHQCETTVALLHREFFPHTRAAGVCAKNPCTRDRRSK